MDSEPKAPRDGAAHAILLAELEQLSAAFLSNEQVGDSRVNIFLAISGALLSALVSQTLLLIVPRWKHEW